MMNPHKRRKGSALVVVMIFAAVFTCLALGYLASASAGLESARLMAASARAHAAAESGMMLARKQLPLLTLSTEPCDSQVALETLVSQITEVLSDTEFGSGTTVLRDNTVYLPAVALDFPEGQASFQVRIVPNDTNGYSVTSIGVSDKAAKTLGADFEVVEDKEVISRYGIASRSPIRMMGNAQVLGVNDPKEGSVLSTSYVTLDPIDITGHVLISGDCAISNPDGDVSYKGNTNIDGDILIGVREPPFPEIDTSQFEPYAVNIVDSSTNTSSDCVLENVRILAGTNPVFSARCTIRGVVYIESPNIVMFNGQTDVTGIIVTEQYDGPLDVTSNHIGFTGGSSATSPSALPDTPEFAAIREMTGSFLLAPGFKAYFDGNFSTINGSIVASRMSFGGTASGTIVGTVLNCDDTYFTMSGDAQVRIDHSQIEETPVGMVFPRKMLYAGGTYTE
jgi:hypothetical protein